MSVQTRQSSVKETHSEAKNRHTRVMMIMMVVVMKMIEDEAMCEMSA